MELPVKINKPQLPIYWDYETSIKFVSESMFKWKNLTEEVAVELYNAREMLSVSKSDAAKIMHGTLVPRKTWSEYCTEIGSSKQVVNRWLKQWFETVHVSHNSGENEWYTPPEIVLRARNTMGSIDLDPASSLLANEIIGAEQIFTENDNGLEQEWSGNIWLNPPYSQSLVSEFSNKLIEELPNIIQACILVNNATETNWFQNLMNLSDAICFLKGRIKFIDKEGNILGTPLQGQAIMYFGENWETFYHNFNAIGICLVKIK